jgi:ribosome modulation factor
MHTLRFYTPYEKGYNAGADGRPRVPPELVENSYPDVRPEWYKGYDDAVSDDPETQKQVQLKFEGNLGEAY